MMMIELSIQLLLYVIVVLLLFCCVVIIYLIFQEKRNSRMKRKMEDYSLNTKIIWRAYILEDAPFEKKLIPKDKIEILEVENILLSYLKNISNEVLHLKIYSFAQMYLKDHYKEELTSRKWSRRMNAVYRIADFQIKELVDTCEVSMKQKGTLEAFQLLKLYSILEKEKFTQALLASDFSFSESEYKKLFSYLEVEMLEQLLEKMEDIQEVARFALIDTIAVKGSTAVVENLEKILSNDNDEIRIRALKGLERVGVIKHIETYTPFVNSPIWEERLMVAKLFKHAPLTFTCRYLEILLQDSNWWVRSQAASTMIEDPKGRQKLIEFIETTTDQYAIDMANEVLEKRVHIR